MVQGRLEPFVRCQCPGIGERIGSMLSNTIPSRVLYIIWDTRMIRTDSCQPIFFFFFGGLTTALKRNGAPQPPDRNRAKVQKES